MSAVAAFVKFRMIDGKLIQGIDPDILLLRDIIQRYLISYLYSVRLRVEYFHIRFSMNRRDRRPDQCSMRRLFPDLLNKRRKSFTIFFFRISKPMQAIIEMNNIKLIITHYQIDLLQQSRVTDTF